MMRKAIVFMLTLVMTLCYLTPCAQAAPSAETPYYSSSPFLFTIGYQGYWVMDSGTLFWNDSNAHEMQRIVTRNDIVAIAAPGEEQSNFVYYLTGSEDSPQVLHAVMSIGNVMYDHASLPEDMRVIHMEANMACLYALDEKGVLYQIFAYSDEPANVYPLMDGDWINAGVTAFALYGKRMLIYQAESSTLTLLDFTDSSSDPAMTASVTVPTLRHMQFGGMDGDVPVIVAIVEENSRGRLSLIRMDDGACEDTGISLNNDISLLGRDKTTLYIRGRKDKALFTLPMREVTGIKENPTLTIVNNLSTGSQREIAAQMFHQRYPDVEIVERSIRDGRVIATEMMAASDDIDIIAMQDSMMSVSAGLLLRSGAILDLNQFEGLVALRENYRDIFGFVSLGDQWFGVPSGHVEGRPWHVNPDLAAELGWEPPTGRWTWAEFAALADRVRAYNETAETPMYLLQDSLNQCYFLYEYQANHVNVLDGTADLNNETYVGMIRLWKELYDDGLLYEDDVWASMGKNVLLHSAPYAMLYHMAKDLYILPPTETEESLYPVCDFGFYVVNANTQHLEEAIYYLECYMSVEAELGRFYFNDGKWLKDTSLYPDYADNPFMNIQWPSEENEALWDYMLEHSAPQLHLVDLIRQQQFTLMPGVLDGTVTPEQFAQISQQLADMMLGE